MIRKKTLILGVGNEILSDDGIGPKLVTNLSRLFNDANLKFETAGSGGLEIMEYMHGYDKVIFIDAIHTREAKPGKVYYFRPSYFRETSNLSNLHDVNFLTAIRLGDILKLDLPSDLHIIAVEIVEDLEFSEELTPEIKKKYPEILAEVLALMNQIILS
ncbi:MAG: hydrogenase maturation protease [Bacteroidales bacterium]